MNIRKFTALVVDDFEPLRRCASSILEDLPYIKVIGEAADGLEAVQKVERLRPDIILLDIGLPVLNGIEAAHRIGRLSPDSKIIFVSQQSTSDVVEAAFSAGARGYVVKMDADSELTNSVDAVLRGEIFISMRLRPQPIPSPEAMRR